MELTTIPTFPPYIVFGIFIALLPFTCIAAAQLKDSATRFVIAAIWLRYLLSALHQYTFPPVIAGLSLNALGSLAVIAVGIAIVDWRHFGL
jgi:hypothetical protein